jgi:hypothetical protein
MGKNIKVSKNKLKIADDLIVPWPGLIDQKRARKFDIFV